MDGLDEQEGGPQGVVPSIDRAVRILGLLETMPQARLTVTEIARRLGIPKSTTFNICGALAAAQLLRRSHDGFQLGRRLVQLGSAYVSSIDLIREFYEACRPVPADLSAMVQLSVLDEGFNAVYLAYQDCGSGLRLGLSGGIGRVVPANCCASGKALLAALPKPVFEERLSRVATLPGLTQKSIISIGKLRTEVAAIHKQGFATDDGGTIPELTCVACTVTASYGEREVVAISITTAEKPLNKKRKDHLREALFQLRELLQARL